MSAFLKNIQNFSSRNKLWEPGNSIIIGVSGGPDSTCLLQVLASIGAKYQWKLRIAHVNYRLRGKESDADEAFVRKLSEKYSIPLSVTHPNVSKRTANLEEKLRDIRYRFFESLRKRHRFHFIAVGHTLDDQAETVLFRLIRGAGPRGLSAMLPKNGFLIRPLLETPRANILKYLEEQGLPYRTDQSNTDPKFTRNRIRNELLPLLETFNPKIRHALKRTALSCHREQGSAMRDLFRALSISSAEKRPPSWSSTEEFLKFVSGKKPKHAKKSFPGLNIERKGDTVQILLRGKNRV